MYITTTIREKPPEQLSFEDLFQLLLENKPDPVYTGPIKSPYTKTWFMRTVPERIIIGCNAPRMVQEIRNFNERYKHLFGIDLATKYRKFYIPKKTGGLREINEPDDELKVCLTELRFLFEHKLYASHHAAAHAYVKGRGTQTAVAVHQRNKSKWFLKSDLSGFFPSTTIDFAMSMLKRIYPFALIVQEPDGEAELRKAISLAFLNGGLPMGSPFSPAFTNVLMVPFDHELSRYLRSRYKPEKNNDGKGRMFVYTRYADDFHISCRIQFDKDEVIAKIEEIFRHFGAPYEIKEEKTHYGSIHGKNWILGVMLNDNFDITIGHRKRKEFRAILSNYCADRKAGKRWRLGELQYVNGLLSYYKMVNEQSIMAVMGSVGKKFGVNIEEMLRLDIRNA